jgi:hypothetical protein
MVLNMVVITFNHEKLFPGYVIEWKQQKQMIDLHNG